MNKVEVVTAVEKYKCVAPISIFLAGGIQHCKDWQKEVISYLVQENFSEDRVVVLNPRRDNFPIDDPNAAEEQIKWEFKALEKCNFFTMYFDNSESDQPICFYELGRNIERMKTKFPLTWQYRILIACDENFKRRKDVEIQTKLATNGEVPVVVGSGDELVRIHAKQIVNAVNVLY